MHKDIQSYHAALSKDDGDICNMLAQVISRQLPEAESKVWHRHPVWFIDGNPIVGYSKLKAGVRLMFWSGASFSSAGLVPGSGKFKDASVTYTNVKKVNAVKVRRWLKESVYVQWDYKNIVKRKGVLKRLK